MDEIKGSDVRLFFNDIEIEGFDEKSSEINIRAKVKLCRQIPPALLCAESPHAWHLWLTQITSNVSHVAYVTWAKPTKRQLRKWKRTTRKLGH